MSTRSAASTTHEHNDPRHALSPISVSGWRIVVSVGHPHEPVFRYLGRSTHRIAISNHRLLKVDGDTVTFATRHGEKKTLSAVAFLKRFLQHIVPKRYVRIRHHGFHVASVVLARAWHRPAWARQGTPSSRVANANNGAFFLDLKVATSWHAACKGFPKTPQFGVGG